MRAKLLAIRDNCASGEVSVGGSLHAAFCLGLDCSEAMRKAVEADLYGLNESKLETPIGEQLEGE